MRFDQEVFLGENQVRFNYKFFQLKVDLEILRKVQYLDIFLIFEVVNEILTFGYQQY